MEKCILNKDEIYINGPVNFFKLKNSKTNKVIYIFFDMHVNIEQQTECDNIYSLNIDKYLKHIFSNSTQKIDFLLEISENSIQDHTNYVNAIYIKKLQKLYIENKNAQQNIRFHFVDIRNYSVLTNISDNFSSMLYNCDSLCRMNFIINKLKYILDDIYAIKYTIEDLKNENKNENKNKNKNKNKDKDKDKDKNKNENDRYKEQAQYYLEPFFTKILAHYENEEIQNSVINFFETFVVKRIDIIIENIHSKFNEYTKIQHTYDNNKDLINYSIIHENKYKTKTFDLNNQLSTHDILSNIKKDILELGKYFMDISMFIMDAYFLRRFLDKNYINNAISYTGAIHSTTYLWFLIKYCDFEIIEHSFVNGVKNNDEFVKIIKKSDDMFDIIKYVFPDKYYQCVKIKPIAF